MVPAFPRCLACCSPLKLRFFVSREGEPSGRRSLVYRYTALFGCGCGRGQIERCDQDFFAPWDMDELGDKYGWYVLEPRDMFELGQMILGCEDPASSDCSCLIHVRMRAVCGKLPIGEWFPPMDVAGSRHRIPVHPVQLRSDDEGYRIDLTDGMG